MSKKELFRRYAVFISGLFFSGVGVAFTKHGDLGVSPISSVSNVLSLKFPVFSLGVWIIIWNCILLTAQIVILRKEFKLYNLLQIPLSILFGWFTDIGTWGVSGINADSYAVKMILLFVGIIILAFGISLTVIADVIMNSGEALVKVISDKIQKEFGYVKIGFDVFCVIAAVLLSVIFFNGRIEGIREGTVISAVISGFIVKFITKLIRKPVTKIIEYKL